MNANALNASEVYDLEEAIVYNLPTEFVSLGGTKYGLRSLTIKRAREWRTKFSPLLNLQKKAQDSDGGELQLELTADLIGQLGGIVAEYIGEGLTAEVLEETATEQELISAFMAIVRHARIPFEQLGRV